MSQLTSSLTPIPVSDIVLTGFNVIDENLIPNVTFTGSFNPLSDKVELFIYDVNKRLVKSNYNFTNYSISQNSATDQSVGTTNVLDLDPTNDAISNGFNRNSIYTVYNFITPLLSSSLAESFYIDQISSNRTEVRLKSNIITDTQITSSFIELQSLLSASGYFDEFYLAFPNNRYYIGVNSVLDTTTTPVSVLVKLYEPLPSNISLKSTLYLASKTAESIAYKIDFILPPFVDTGSFIQGPNFNIDLSDTINNSTVFKSKNDILNTSSSSSLFNLQSVLNVKGIDFALSYSYDNFSEFVHFSSAKTRIENFYYKAGLIENYQNNINILSAITGSTSSSFQTSSSIALLYSNIENIIKNFDGYDYHLYYSSGSDSYPKSNSTYPYTLYSTSSVTVLNWLGSDVENSQYYGGILLSASFYDSNNQNWLYYTIPEFIRNNSDNNAYIDFINMMGQYYDEIWLYIKFITQKLNSTNNLDEGIPLQLAQNVIESLGFDTYGNNINNDNIFVSLIGENSGSFVPPTGSELITQYIAVNKSASIPNYWASDYPSSSIGTNFISPVNDTVREIYKRIYHNAPYLIKKKGTISGLRQLINIWGVPNTILRINEFGGKNKDNTNDWDQWYDKYSYAYTPVPLTQSVASSSVRIPWMPLERNRIATNQYIVPDVIQFRFKTHGYPSSSVAGTFFSQSLLVKKSDDSATSTNFDFGIALYYTGSTLGSYSGSSTSDYANWGILKLYMSGSSANGGTAQSSNIYLPFFDGGW